MNRVNNLYVQHLDCYRHVLLVCSWILISKDVNLNVQTINHTWRLWSNHSHEDLDFAMSVKANHMAVCRVKQVDARKEATHQSGCIFYLFKHHE